MTPSQAAQEKPTSPACDVCGGFDPPHTPYWRDNQNRTCDPCEARIQQRVEIAVAEREAAAATPSLDPDLLALAICKGLDIKPTQAAAEPFFANAPFIAAEYARLDEGSATPDQGKGEPR